MKAFRVWSLGAGSVAVAFALAQSLACSSSSSGPTDNDGGSGSSSGGSSSNGGSSGTGSSGSSGAGSSGSSSGAMDQEGGGGSSSSSGGSSGGGCDAGVYSYDMASANSCIASYAPRMPSGFTAGHCPAGTDGCCFKQGPCGFTSNCNYNIAPIVSQAMTQCANTGGTWQTTAP